MCEHTHTACRIITRDHECDCLNPLVAADSKLDHWRWWKRWRSRSDFQQCDLVQVFCGTLGDMFCVLLKCSPTHEPVCFHEGRISEFLFNEFVFNSNIYKKHNIGKLELLARRGGLSPDHNQGSTTPVPKRERRGEGLRTLRCWLHLMKRQFSNSTWTWRSSLQILLPIMWTLRSCRNGQGSSSQQRARWRCFMCENKRLPVSFCHAVVQYSRCGTF